MNFNLNANYIDQRFKSDEAFQIINRKFITLADEEIKQNNVYLKEVLEEFVRRMKESDAFFKDSFREIKYVGSFYKGTKVGSPEEFDINLIITLPIKYNTMNIQSDNKCKSYIKIQLKDDTLRQSLLPYKVLKKFITDDLYLNQNEFRQWMESVVDKARLTLPMESERCHYLVKNGKKYIIRVKKSSPAFTLLIDVQGGSTLNVDLVAALVFTDPPPRPFRKITQTEKSWRAIAKPFNNDNMPNANIVWRPFFYEQEKEILQYADVKPVIRQMKKLRDTLGLHSIASYYIESLFYWELERCKNDKHFLTASKTCLFFNMLKRLCEATLKGEIKDFWHEEYNLLWKIGPAHMSNMHGKLKRIIIKIEQNIENDGHIIKKFILTQRELQQLQENVIQDKFIYVTQEDPQVLHNSLSSQRISNDKVCNIL